MQTLDSVELDPRPPRQVPAAVIDILLLCIAAFAATLLLASAPLPASPNTLDKPAATAPASQTERPVPTRDVQTQGMGCRDTAQVVMVGYKR